ncbi:MAG: membrane protein insertion efficiency factor YidD [Ilumatobacteraceae bacterium]
MLRAITWYREQRAGHPSPCRFFPTCSEYGYESIERFGAWRGGWLTLRRLTRCRPFGPSGFDPVTEHLGEVHYSPEGHHHV